MPAGKRDGIRLLYRTIPLLWKSVVCEADPGPGRLAVVGRISCNPRFTIAPVWRSTRPAHLLRHSGPEFETASGYCRLHLKGIMVITARKPVFPVYYPCTPSHTHRSRNTAALISCPYRQADGRLQDVSYQSRRLPSDTTLRPRGNHMPAHRPSTSVSENHIVSPYALKAAALAECVGTGTLLGAGLF